MGAVNSLAVSPTATVNINVSSSSQSVQVSPSGNAQPVRFMNDGTATVWLAWGKSTVTASLTTGVPVGAGSTEVLTMDSQGGGALYVAVIAAGATGNIYFTAGSDGI